MTKRGIDISSHQGNIDLATLKSQIDFVIIRVGYGTNGTLDTKFKRNADLCVQLGIPFGFYWYSYALNVEGARREAEAFLNAIEQYKNKYSSIINSKTNTVNNLTYAIMIYESLNTPVFNRKIEEYIGAVSKTETKYGIMRIKSYNHLTDEESIKIVLEKLEQDYKSLKDKKALNTIINSYNDIEKEDILTIYNQIVEFSKK